MVLFLKQRQSFVGWWVEQQIVFSLRCRLHERWHEEWSRGGCGEDVVFIREFEDLQWWSDDVKCSQHHHGCQMRGGGTWAQIWVTSWCIFSRNFWIKSTCEDDVMTQGAHFVASRHWVGNSSLPGSQRATRQLWDAPTGTLMSVGKHVMLQPDRHYTTLTFDTMLCFWVVERHVPCEASQEIACPPVLSVQASQGCPSVPRVGQPWMTFHPRIKKNAVAKKWPPGHPYFCCDFFVFPLARCPRYIIATP